MACSDFFSCLSPETVPTPGLGSPPHGGFYPGGGYYLTNLTSFAVNFIKWGVYSALIVYILFYLFQGVYRLAFGEDQDNMKIVKDCFTRVLVATIALLVVISMTFWLGVVLQTMGVSSGTNIFVNYKNWF